MTGQVIPFELGWLRAARERALAAARTASNRVIHLSDDGFAIYVRVKPPVEVGTLDKQFERLSRARNYAQHLHRVHGWSIVEDLGGGEAA